MHEKMRCRFFITVIFFIVCYMVTTPKTYADEYDSDLDSTEAFFEADEYDSDNISPSSRRRKISPGTHRRTRSTPPSTRHIDACVQNQDEIKKTMAKKAPSQPNLESASSPIVEPQREAVSSLSQNKTANSIESTPKEKRFLKLNRSDALQRSFTVKGALKAAKNRVGKELRICTIDGGGTRGCIPVRFLQEIKELSEKNAWEMFDVFGAASTGAIIVVSLLARNKDSSEPLLNLDEIMDMYMTKSEEIFGVQYGFYNPHPEQTYAEWGKSIWKGMTLQNGWYYTSKFLNILNPYGFKKRAKDVLRLWNPGGLIGPKYSSRPRENIFSEFLGDLTMLDTARDIVIPFFDGVSGKPIFYSTSAVRNKELPNIRLVDLLMAATAAPSYFEGHEFWSIDGERRFIGIDGGTFANNTAKDTYLIARAWDPHERNVMLLSLGTGLETAPHDPERFKLMGLPAAALYMINTATVAGSQKDNEQMVRRLNKAEQNYLRLNPSLDELRAELDNVESDFLESLVAKAEAHLSEDFVQTELVKFVKRLSVINQMDPGECFERFMNLQKQIDGPDSVNSNGDMVEETSYYNLTQGVADKLRQAKIRAQKSLQEGGVVGMVPQTTPPKRRNVMCAPQSPVKTTNPKATGSRFFTLQQSGENVRMPPRAMPARRRIDGLRDEGNLGSKLASSMTNNAPKQAQRTNFGTDQISKMLGVIQESNDELSPTASAASSTSAVSSLRRRNTSRNLNEEPRHKFWELED